MSKQTASYVRCCRVTTDNDVIGFIHDTDRFYLGTESADFYDPIIRCPWCGILLDSNLPMDSEG